MSVEDVVKRALANPSAALRALDMLDAQERLIDFVKLTWGVLEPGRKLIDGWAIRAICEHLEAVTSGQIRKLLINVPPNTMKSLAVDVFWPAWEWGPKNMPDKRYVCASYSEALTVRDNRRCRSLILSSAYQELWGSRVSLSGDQTAKVRFDTSRTGFKIATSIGGLGTGERGDRFIIDDPHNVKDGESEAKREAVLQWFTEVVPTRLNDPEKSAIVVVMQRVHERDVSGLILAKELGYEHLCLPMEFEADRKCRTSIGWEDPRREDGELLWPERFSRKYLEEDLKPALRAWGGTYAEAGQLQQRPTLRGGGMFQRKDFQFLDEAPSSGRRCRGWDLAATRDGRAAATAAVRICVTTDGKVVVEDVRRIQGTPGEVEALISETAALDGPDVLQYLPQDPGQAGKAQKMSLARLLSGHRFRFSPETGAKEDRARPLAAQAEAGNLYVVRGPWNVLFVSELCSFPAGQWKDQVDAASRAYSGLVERTPRSVSFVAPTLVRGA